MAWCSRQPDHEHDRTIKVTILASEWGSSKGGLSTINRELAIQLAKCCDCKVTFFLLKCSHEDKEEAQHHGISIVKAEESLGYEELDWLSFPPQDLQIDVIVGHGMKLGKQAQVIRRSHKCKWIQVVHTEPEKLGMFKCYDNPISKGEKKHHVEVELCQRADLVVGVGPKLTEAFRKYLRWCKKDVFEFTPGVFADFASVEQTLREGKRRSVLVIGRGDDEDFNIKGFDIAARSVASLPDTDLVFVGATDGKEEEIANRLHDCGIPKGRLTVRAFKDREALKRLFCEVDLVLMPSRTEGFGLTGLEALSAGLPVIVSKNSGFGEALSSVPNSSSFVIDSEDPSVWTEAIKAIWNKDRQLRLVEVQIVRDHYEKKYAWSEQCKSLFEKVVSLLENRQATAKDSKRIDVVKHLREITPAGTTEREDKSVTLPGNVIKSLVSPSCDPKEIVLQLKENFHLDQTDLEKPSSETTRMIRCFSERAKDSKRIDVVKHLREITPAGTTGPLLPGKLDICDIPVETMRELTIDLTVRDWRWKAVAERLGLRANEIEFLDVRYPNPSEAALAFVAQYRGMNVDDLYDVLTECGMPALADIL